MHIAQCTSLKTVNSNLGVEIARDTMAKFANCPTLFSACIYLGRGELDEGGRGGAREVGRGVGGGEDYVFTPPTGSYHIHLFQGLLAH
jgi:hypothetical protein